MTPIIEVRVTDIQLIVVSMLVFGAALGSFVTHVICYRRKYV